MAIVFKEDANKDAQQRLRNLATFPIAVKQLLISSKKAGFIALSFLGLAISI